MGTVSAEVGVSIYRIGGGVSELQDWHVSARELQESARQPPRRREPSA